MEGGGRRGRRRRRRRRRGAIALLSSRRWRGEGNMEDGEHQGGENVGIIAFSGRQNNCLLGRIIFLGRREKFQI